MGGGGLTLKVSTANARMQSSTAVPNCFRSAGRMSPTSSLVVPSSFRQ